MKIRWIIAGLLLSGMISCNRTTEYDTDFNNTNDRIWIGKDFWSIPIEDWKINGGRIESTGEIPESRVMMLTHSLVPAGGSFRMSVRAGLLEKGESPGSAGFLIGMDDEVDHSVKSVCYFGKGIRAGVSLEGYAFLKDKRLSLPEDFNWDAFTMTVKGDHDKLSLEVKDAGGNSPGMLTCDADSLKGLLGVATNLKLKTDHNGTSKFWFDDWKLSGTRVAENPEEAFGPVLWTMYTLSKKSVKLMAFLPPVGAKDNREVKLQLKKNGEWADVLSETIEPDTRTAVFSVDDWDPSKDAAFRVEYDEREKTGI